MKMGRSTLRNDARIAAESGGPPLPFPKGLDDLGPIMARWPLMLMYDAPSGQLWKRYVWETTPDRTFLVPEQYVASSERTVGNKVRCYVRIDGFTVQADRVVWLLHHGRWPEGRLRHLDGDLLNDRIENLEDLGHEPRYAARERKRPVGVARYYDRWQAYATLPDGRMKKIGVFRTEADAVTARGAWDAARDLV